MRKKIRLIITHPLFSGSTIMILGSNSASAVNYVYHFLMGRLLGPSSYGELASLISVIGLLGVIPGSISLVIVKQVSEAKNESEINYLVGWFKKKIFILSLIFSISVLIASPLIASFLNIRKVSYLIIIALSLLFSLQSGFYRAILQGLLKFKEMVMSILAENGLKLILSVILVYMGLQVSGAIFALLISIFLGWYITNLFLKSYSPDDMTSALNTKKILKFAVPFIIQSFATTSLYTSDVILVKHFFPSYEAGIYAALSTLGKIIFFGSGPINTVMFPLVSQRKSRGESYSKIFSYSFLVTIIFAFIISIFYFLKPKLAINMLYGGAYLAADKLLIWFGIFMTLFTLSFLLINYNLSLSKTRVTVLPTIAAIAQIIFIIFFHQNLFTVIFISIVITSLLLITLLIYSSYGNKFNFSHSPHL